MRLHPPGGPDKTPGVPTTRPNDSTGHGPKSELVRKLFLPWEALGRPWSGPDSRWRPQPDAGGALCLLCGGDAEDVL
jgi:hypothetical protein